MVGVEFFGRGEKIDGGRWFLQSVAIVGSYYHYYISVILSASPQLLNQQEMSVYDLRDHPDFRYRPGSVVIRVANFEENQSCYTGQVLDNFPSGEVSLFAFTDKTMTGRAARVVISAYGENSVLKYPAFLIFPSPS